MDIDLKRIAKLIAVIGFFILAGVGCANGVPPFVCGMRALAGAVILFVSARIAGSIVQGWVLDPLEQKKRANKSRGISL